MALMRGGWIPTQARPSRGRAGAAGDLASRSRGAPSLWHPTPLITLRARGAGSNRRRRPLRHAADVSNAERPWRAQQRATRTRECPPLRPRPAAGCFRSTLRDGSSAPAVRELDGRAPDPSAGTPARPPQPLACRTRPPPARPFSVRRSSRPARCATDASSLARAARLQSSVNAAACDGVPALSAANPNPSP